MSNPFLIDHPMGITAQDDTICVGCLSPIPNGSKLVYRQYGTNGPCWGPLCVRHQNETTKTKETKPEPDLPVVP